MARSKNSRALFEVIKQSQAIQARKQLPRPPRQPNPLLTWFKRRGELTVETREAKLPVMREIPRLPTDSQDSSASTSPDIHTDGPEQEHGDEHLLNDESVSQPESSEADEIQQDDHFADDATEESAFGEGESAAVPDAAVAAGSLADDSVLGEQGPSEQPLPRATPRRAARSNQIHLVLSYPSIAIAAIAMMLLMIVAFLAGRQTARPIALSGPSLEQIQSGKPSPDVLNLGSSPTHTTLTQPEDAPAGKSNTGEPPSTPAEEGSSAATPDRRRVIGRNYIIAQSYPDPDNAAKAADVLVKNNIPVTVEQIDAAPGWYCVVTEVGFDRISTGECDRYQKLIRDANAQAKAARLKAFEPYLFKWK